MGSQDRVGERTFRVNFSQEGTEKLSGRLIEMLKDYMGDIVDDTLVDYVIVLLGNGRSKEEVKEDLDVFLGDKTDSFVMWLWDHLASNINQYIESHESHDDEVVKVNPESMKHVDLIDSRHSVIDDKRGKSDRLSRSRHNREWKGLVTDDSQPPPFCSSFVDHNETEKKAHHSALNTRQSVSPEPPFRRKRKQPDEKSRSKRELPRATIDAPRRLLQFAVRDAVATTKPLSSVLEPTQKRLRSVVSSPTGNFTEEVHLWKRRSVTSLPHPMATAIKAVADAAEDVKKEKTRNVFDRLSHGDDMWDSPEQLSIFRESVIQDHEYDNYDYHEKPRRRYLHAADDSGQHDDAFLVDSSTGFVFDSAEVHSDVGVLDHRVINAPETCTSGVDKVDDSLLMHYNGNANDMMHHPHKRDQEPVSLTNIKHKNVNTSANVFNTWKSPCYQPPREMVEVETQKSSQETAIGISNMLVMKENSNPVAVVANGIPTADAKFGNQKTVMSVGPDLNSTLEDADSRTIFINNVHFAATKDSLSQHFNKFGEVLKVIILTDATTGHPKGSAYIEFMSREAAENALSLNGTSFMSRIIKVAKKSSSPQETGPNMVWPRVTRSSPFAAVPRFARASFPRAFPGGYRARLPMKLGARSMQWKRGSQQTSAENVTSTAGSTSHTPPGRGFTYVRTESKSDGFTGGA